MNLLQLLELAKALGPVALSSAALLHTLLFNRRKGLPVTDLPEPVVVSGAGATSPVEAVADKPIATALAEPPAAPVNSSAIVNSVVQTVTAHPDVAPSAAPSIIANILAGLYAAEPAIFAVSRASMRTQTEAGLGLGLAQIILGAFLQR